VLRTVLATAGAAGLLALTACAGSSGTTGSNVGAAAGGSSSAPASTSAAELTTWQSPLGTILVTGAGRAVYAFDKDTPGSATSACTGACVALWPAVTTTAPAPTVSGVTGTVGTVATADGGKQVTVDGHRLYTYSGDSGSGQTAGQGFMKLWWVVSPSGATVTKAAAASSSPPAPSSAGTGGYSY
jgi:predicted lipoprotein with Yx(FWY)xxD motif